MNLDEYAETLGYVPRRICVFGPPKSGKTELVGALAAYGYNLHFFDLDNGIKTLLRSDSKAKGHLKNIKLFRIPDTQSYNIGWTTVNSVLKGGRHHICHLHGAHNCLKCTNEEKKGTKVIWTDINLSEFGPMDIFVIDSMSQLISSVMAAIIRKEIDKGNDDYKPDWDDWRKQGWLGDRIFSIIQAGHFNCIVISHEELQQLEGGAKRLVPVGGTGNYSKTFAKYWDDIIYTDVVNGTFRAYSAVEPGLNALVGSRSGKKLDTTKGMGLIDLFKD